MKVFPIKRCIPDILVAIFQALVDDEAAAVDPRCRMESIKRQVTATVSLVCKEWKEIVYNAPSLWILIAIDAHNYINNPSKTVLPSRLIQMGKGAPVDLFLFNFPVECPDAPVIDSLFTSVPNIRKLHVELVTTGPHVTSPPLLLSRPWTALRGLRELSYFVSSPHALEADLTAHLLAMPCLVSLWLNQPGFTVPYLDKSNHPSLPKLKGLTLHGSFVSGSHTAATMTPAFLSHCPALEALDLTIMDPHSPLPIEDPPLRNSHSLALTRLQKVKSSGTAALVPFISPEIKTPALSDLSLFNYTDTSTPSVAQLFTQNAQTLRTLFLSVTDDAHFQQAIAPLTHLTSLSLLATTGRGAFLAPLYEDHHSTLPSLRFLKVSMNRHALSATYFSKLVRARAIPVSVNPNAERRTVAEYCALENFVLVALNPPMVLKHVRETVEWKSAAILKPRACVFEMWWDVQPTT